jgi:hypothetical protein
LMNIHHDTSLRSILKDDSILSSSRACICSCLGKGARLWLVVRPSIRSFCIAHFIFTLALRFCFGLIQPSASNLLVWTRVGCIWHTLNLLPVWRLVDSHTQCHPRRHVCPHFRKWACCIERVVVRLYVRSFITS